MAESLWIIPFGKHKGEPVEDVPTSYLEWLLEQDWFCNGSKPEHMKSFDSVQKELAFRKRFSDGDQPKEDRNWNRSNRERWQRT